MDILSSAVSDVDWDDLVNLCCNYSTEPSVYYTLLLCDRVGRIPIPHTILQSLRKRFERRSHYRDFGDLTGRLLRLPRVEEWEVKSS